MSRISNCSLVTLTQMLCKQFWIQKWLLTPTHSYCCYLDYYCVVLYCIVLYCIVLYCIVLYCNVNVGGSRMEIVVTCQLEHSLRGHCFEMGLNWASMPTIYSTSSSSSPDIWQCREVLSGRCLLYIIGWVLKVSCVLSTSQACLKFLFECFGVQNEFSYTLVSRQHFDVSS